MAKEPRKKVGHGARPKRPRKITKRLGRPVRANLEELLRLEVFDKPHSATKIDERARLRIRCLRGGPQLFGVNEFGQPEYLAIKTDGRHDVETIGLITGTLVRRDAKPRPLRDVPAKLRRRAYYRDVRQRWTPPFTRKEARVIRAKAWGSFSTSFSRLDEAPPRHGERALKIIDRQGGV